MGVCMLSHVCLFVTLWTVAQQAPLTMGFSRQEYWSGLPFPSSGNLPNLGIKPTSLMSPALSGGFFTTSAAWEALVINNTVINIVYKFLFEHFNYLGYIPKLYSNGISGSCGNSIFTFLRNYNNVFHRSCTIFYSH